MKLQDANNILRDVNGRDYGYLYSYGISTIKEAIRTVQARKHVKEEDVERAESVWWRIYMKW